jgi:hypothetical protein
VRVVFLLAILTLAVHGLALSDGKVLDDFWHQKGLREHGWSFNELLRTLVIAPADFLHTWWQTKPVVWHYFRPFFILSMKVVLLVLGGGNPVALHAFSLALHFASAVMVWRLCWLLTRDRAWSFVGGALFVIYPHSVITVAWPSAQNVVLQTTLLLATVLCYLRASGLDLRPDFKHPASAIPHPPSLARLPLAFTLMFWLLALFTRENAVLLPIILAAFDLSFGGRRHLWSRRYLYGALVIISTAFMAWRFLLHIPPLPDVYCRRPDGDWPEYLPWLAAKLLHYICASIWISPIGVGPTGRYNPWTEVLDDCLLMLAIVSILFLVYWRSTREVRGWWIWPLWIVLSILPVTAVIATPHSGYMCGVGWAVACALAPAAARTSGSLPLNRGGPGWGSGGTRTRPLYKLAAGTTLVLALGAAFMSPVNRLQWTGIAAAERLLPSWVMVSPPPRETTDVFFINMPFVNLYCKPVLVDRLGPWFEEVNVHVLTFAPALFKLNEPTFLEQRDDRSFTVEVLGQPYFSRLLGRFALEAFRGKGRFKSGDEIVGSHFTVRILDAEEEGVRKLLFTFPRPLSDPRYCFYLTSTHCGAARIRFGDTSKAASAVEGLKPPALEPAVARHMAITLGAPVQRVFDQPSLCADDWRRVAAWWSAHVDAQALDEIWHHRHDFDDLVYLRYEVDFDRHIAGLIIQTDLYLTGPPFPGPRP